MARISDGKSESSGLPEPTVELRGGELRLIVDGAVQSVAMGDPETAPNGYWPALAPSRQPETVLILGLGGGTLAQILKRQWPDVAITGIDDDPKVLALARERFGLDDAAITVVETDARVYVRGCREHFDLVVVDLYRGETAAEFLGYGAFIRAIRRLVTPGGVAVWNLPRDQRGATLRKRVGRGLALEQRTLAGMNLVLHYRRRCHTRLGTGGPPRGTSQRS